ncbi:isochorismatase family protein [Ruficoccus amylovorans]|uniref:Isochorismatase family protein n=1 Tax=Ruficoccus amylovorans TaxID=1804625 RepID=A0A842HDC6_9BACT|nr:isochorismatase family protein [Ruficoccus amylovorans]MBC2594058.1 isochorismatase family protein [Ruficoccus amylovorans]
MNEESGQPTRKIVLLVLDMQETFLKVMPEREQVVGRCSFAISAARLLGIDVAFTEQMPDKLGPTLPELRALAPEAPVFPKHAFSGLDADGMEAYLSEGETEGLLIAGLETPVCVYQTALAAHNQNLVVTLLSDALTCRRAGDGGTVLKALRHSGCHVLPTETIFYSLLADARHPAFRAYTQLVKKYG